MEREGAWKLHIIEAELIEGRLREKRRQQIPCTEQRCNFSSKN